jgi:hypothetical protein
MIFLLSFRLRCDALSVFLPQGIDARLQDVVSL